MKIFNIIYVLEKTKHDMKRATNGEISFHNDAEQRMAKWLQTRMVKRIS